MLLSFMFGNNITKAELDADKMLFVIITIIGRITSTQTDACDVFKRILTRSQQQAAVTVNCMTSYQRTT